MKWLDHFSKIPHILKPSLPSKIYKVMVQTWFAVFLTLSWNNWWINQAEAVYWDWLNYWLTPNAWNLMWSKIYQDVPWNYYWNSNEDYPIQNQVIERKEIVIDWLTNQAVNEITWMIYTSFNELNKKWTINLIDLLWVVRKVWHDKKLSDEKVVSLFIQLFNYWYFSNNEFNILKTYYWEKLVDIFLKILKDIPWELNYEVIYSTYFQEYKDYLEKLKIKREKYMTKQYIIVWGSVSFILLLIWIRVYANYKSNY